MASRNNMPTAMPSTYAQLELCVTTNSRYRRTNSPVMTAISASEKENRRKAPGWWSSIVDRGKKLGMLTLHLDKRTAQRVATSWEVRGPGRGANAASDRITAG